MTKSTLGITFLTFTLALCAAPAQAYEFFSGIDENDSSNPNTQLPSDIPNSNNAFFDFFDALDPNSFFAQDFESVDTDNGQVPFDDDFPLELPFSKNALTNLTLTSPPPANPLDPDAVVAALVDPNVTNGSGGFPITSPNFIELSAGKIFTVTFSSPIEAFGFFGTDIGDFDGTLQLQITQAGGSVEFFDVPTLPSNRANGSVLFYGLIAQSSTEYISAITFQTQGSSLSDIFAFDDFVTGATPTGQPTTPEPSTLLSLLGLGIFGLARRHKKA